jgi:hypothetical protein
MSGRFASQRDYAIDDAVLRAMRRYPQTIGVIARASGQDPRWVTTLCELWVRAGTVRKHGSDAYEIIDPKWQDAGTGTAET